jgi:hypothetical protein
MRRLTIILISIPLIALAPDRNRSFMREQQDVLQFTTQAVTTSRSNIGRDTLKRLGLLWRNNLPEGSDGVPLVVTNVATPQGLLDLVITAQGTGRLTANNAWTGEMVWHTEPPKGPHYSTSSPAIDPTRQYVYVYGLDGYVHKHRVGDGAEIRSFGFPALITRKPDVEKGSSNIAIATARDGQTYLYMTIAAYPDPGDEGDYQGHVVGINLSNGQQRVFNALCSDRPIHFDASGGRQRHRPRLRHHRQRPLQRAHRRLQLGEQRHRALAGSSPRPRHAGRQLHARRLSAHQRSRSRSVLHDHHHSAAAARLEAATPRHTKRKRPHAATAQSAGPQRSGRPASPRR